MSRRAVCNDLVFGSPFGMQSRSRVLLEVSKLRIGKQHCRSSSVAFAATRTWSAVQP